MELTEDIWEGCYREGWKGLIVPEAFAHPAKYSRTLIRRIYEHVMAEGWVTRGDSVVDPFGGVALGGFDAMQLGLNWTGCELEVKFVGLGNQNIALWNERFSRMPNWGTARLVQGDSRKLIEVIAGADLAVSSPPYAGNEKSDYLLSEDGKTRRRDVKRGFKQGHGCFRGSETYGQSEGQLGAMKEGDLNLAISSPPYVAISPEKSSKSVDYAKQYETYRSQGGGASFEKFVATQELHSGGYGHSEGQLSAMKTGDHSIAITSPPYNPPMSQDHNGSRGGQRGTTPSEKGAFVKYGNTEGQLEGMSMEGFDAAVSSPPYEGIRQDGAGIHKEVGDQKGFRPYTDDPLDAWPTQRDQNNIGNNRPDDFWSASRVILEQLFQVIVPGGHAVFVVKAFVRNKQIVDFPGQWAQLCEAVGFRLVHHHHASLVELGHEQSTLEGEIEQKRVERKSFFRRLAESKGSPRIDHESVLCFIKPLN